jgi:hypothetical protein
MSLAGTMLLTYVWHYVVARLIYDDLVRPLARGHALPFVLAALILVAALLFGLRRRRRSR